MRPPSLPALGMLGLIVTTAGADAPAPARQQDPVRATRIFETPHDDVLGHERRDLDADVLDTPLELRIHAFEDRLQARLGQMPGDK